MKKILKKKYVRPALLKHGLLKKLTLKTGSTTDFGLPGEFEP